MMIRYCSKINKYFIFATEIFHFNLQTVNYQQEKYIKQRNNFLYFGTDIGMDFK